MPEYPPTDEQQRAVDLYLTGQNVVIEALAGTGKTTALQFIAGASPGRRGLYAAFNKGIATEAQRRMQGTGVLAKTMHSLAFAGFGAQMQGRLSNRKPVMWAEKAQILHINDKYLFAPSDGARTAALSRQQLVKLTTETVNAFMRTAAEQITPDMVPIPPDIGKLTPRAAAGLANTVTAFAQRYWEDLQNPNGGLKYSHDAYLKAWQLSHPSLPYDYILFDECQPQGTEVWTTRKGFGDFAGRITKKPIEDIHVGDTVVSYNRSGRLRANGARVAGISSRPFDGDLITVETESGLRSEYTPNHRCIAVFGPAFMGKHAVYLMKRGNSYRVGTTGPRRVARERTTDGWGRFMPLGLTSRLAEERADAIWVLDVFEDRAEARLAEEAISARYGLPQTRFRVGSSRVDVSQTRLDEHWADFGDLTDRASAALAAFGRDIRYPFSSRETNRSVTYWRPREIRASNLMSGMLVIDANVAAASKGQWAGEKTHTPIVVGRRPYRGKVWSMTIDPDQTYVGDGIVTHNCQDADALTIDVIRRQDHAQIVVVGDRNQAIYGWRGASMAMDEFGGTHTALRMSFRFGDEIAHVANEWLDLMGSDPNLRVRGLPGKPSSVWDSERIPEAVLTRTNGGALQEAVESQMSGTPTGIAGERKARELRDLAQAANDLQEKGWTKHPELASFNTWNDVVGYADSEDGGDLKPFVDIVEKVGASQVVRVIDSCVPVDRARTVVSTAHVAKGLEWKHVRISDDFRDPGDRKGVPKPILAEEARLAYVAVTRAMRHLDRRGFAWVPEYLARGGWVEGNPPAAAHVSDTAAGPVASPDEPVEAR